MSTYTLETATRVWVKPGYNNRIDYSDGAEVERQLFEIVQGSTDISSVSGELESKIFNWPSRYFFSNQRSNLLRPFASLLKGRKILEPGAGAGTISRFLGECGAVVTAVEPAMPRARIAAERCRDLPEVKIVCDDIGSFQPEEKFDGIVVVGLLEYSTKYSGEADAPLKFLLHLKQFLKQDGFLITAIENQLGLKYFSGFAEDHIGIVMHGINNNYQPGQSTTWGRKVLMELFEQAGFTSNELFLPFPDYKLPSIMIYPHLYEKDPPHFNFLCDITYQDPQPYTPIFSMDKALPLIAQNGLLYDLSNSFCLFTQVKPTIQFDKEVLYASYNNGVETLVRQCPPDNSSQLELVKILNHHGWRIDQMQQWAKDKTSDTVITSLQKLSSIAEPENPLYRDASEIMRALGLPPTKTIQLKVRPVNLSF